MGGGKTKKAPGKQRCCGICGKPGHRREVCPDKDQAGELEEKAVASKVAAAPRNELTAKADAIELSQELKEHVNFLVREGGGINAVKESYDLTRAEAVRLISRVKNVDVPDVESGDLDS